MIQNIIYFFGHISFFEACVVTLFLCLCVWSFLWQHEAKMACKKGENFWQELKGLQKALHEIEAPIAYKGRDRCYANKAFCHLWNVHNQEQLLEFLRTFLQERLKVHDFQTMYHSLKYTHAPFTQVLEKNHMPFCVCIQAHEEVISITMMPFDASDNFSKYTESIVHNLPFPLWYRDMHGDLVYCNEAYAEYFHNTCEEVLQNQWELIPKQRKISPYDQHQRVKVTQSSVTDRLHLIVDGGRRYMEMQTFPLATGDSMGFLTDLTALEEAQKLSEKQHEGHREILSHLSTGIAIYGSDTRLEFFNFSFVKFFDFNENWLQTRPTLGDILEDLRSRRKIQEYVDFQKYKKECFLRFTTLLNPEERLMHQPDGRTFRMCIVPYKMGGLFYMFDDVTEKLGLQTQYKTLSAVQKQTIDNLFEGILVFTSQGRLHIINQACCRLFHVKNGEKFLGYTLKECLDYLYELSKTFSSTHHAAQGEEDLNIQNIMMRMHTLFHERLPHKSDIRLLNRILEYAYTPLPDGSHLISLSDVTEVRRLHAALKEHNRLLEEVDDAKTHFIRYVSHELKSPMGELRSFAETHLGDHAEKNKDDQVPTQKVLASTQKLLVMLDDILDVSNLESRQLTLTPSQFSVDQFVENIMAMVKRPLQEKGITLHKEMTLENDFMYGDHKRLKQGFLNALTAILSHAKEGGTLFLRGETVMENRHAMVRFSVSNDKEIPLKKAHVVAPHVFGATLLKRIVALHGGQLSCKATQIPEKSTKKVQNMTKNLNKESHFVLVCTLPQTPILLKEEAPLPLLKSA